MHGPHTQVLKAWARILSAVPGSRLVLKNKPFACETARTHILNLLAAEVRRHLQAFSPLLLLPGPRLAALLVA